MIDTLFALDWRELLIPQDSLLEIFVRGTFIYFLLLVLLRIFKRQAGAIGISDLLVVVLLADASQNAMATDYKSLTEGALLIVTIIAWDYLLDWVGYHVPGVERLLRPPPVLLVKDGKVNARNMRHEMITRDELMSQIREQGVLELTDVRRAFIEGDGKISVIRADGQGGGKKDRRTVPG